MPAARISARLATRGVYWAAALKNGRPQAYAVDSTGNEVDRVVLDNDSWTSAEAVVDWLWARLGEVDPLEKPTPVLQLPRTGDDLRRAGNTTKARARRSTLTVIGGGNQ